MSTNLMVCPNCGQHHKLTCKERFEIFFDNKDLKINTKPAPKLGGDSRKTLKNLGLKSNEINKLIRSGVIFADWK